MSTPAIFEVKTLRAADYQNGLMPLEGGGFQQVRATIEIEYWAGWSDSTSGYVTIELWDIESDEAGVKIFDAQISTSNNDNLSLREQQQLIALCLDHFYANYSTAFGMLIGEY